MVNECKFVDLFHKTTYQKKNRNMQRLNEKCKVFYKRVEIVKVEYTSLDIGLM